MKAQFRKGMLVVAMPLINPARKSKSGKTFMVASSGGPRRTSLRFNKKPVVIILCAYVRPDGYARKAEIARRKTARTVQRKRQRSKPKTEALNN
jgi:hypothetical protein